MKSFSTLCELISFQASNFSNEKALNFKENNQWKSFSNQEFLNQAFYFACGLKEIGLQKNQTLAIASYQNPIWLIADYGSILAGATTVPIFHNISKENLLYEISDAKVQYIFTDNLEFIETIKFENLDLKIITYGFSKENSTSFEELILLGKKAIEAKKYNLESFLEAANPQDLATIIYTSGSTGVPKGVELTHQNLVSQIKDTAEFFPLFKEDVVLSFLPLAHIFERMVMSFYITQGVSIYFANDVKDVGGLLKEVKPNLMTAVPRVLEKFYGRIRDGVEMTSGFKKCLARKALSRALNKHPDQQKSFLDKTYDSLIYKKFRDGLGGNMRMIICGGAALSLDMEKFYKNIGVNLFCGYGLTEAAPVLAVNCPKASKFGTIGKAFPSVELKLGEDGELLGKGPNIMRGYHNQPEKTAEVIENGWLKTGDLAQIDEEGFVKIIGRKKELFKNSNGKYISPVPIEQKLIQNLGFLLGAIIIAEGRKFTSALLFPDFETLSKSKEKFKFLGSDEEFLKSEMLQDFTEEKISKINKNLDHWEQIQKFSIIIKEISIESGDITPSMKLKRNVLEKKFGEIVEKFYV